MAPEPACSNSRKKTTILAEIGNTHEGSVGLAKQFIRAAADCGADAVKFQIHVFEAESLPDAPAPPYFTDESRRDYFQRTAFSLQQWQTIKHFAEEECDLTFLASVFSIEALRLAETLKVGIHKIPSGEVTNLPLLEIVAATGKPVLLSSGMSSWPELDTAVKALREGGCLDPVVLQCTTEYPCEPAHSGLNVLSEMKKRYNCRVGFSDHTLGIGVSIAAIALGATFIEKHFTLSRRMYGSDAAHSMEPEEFKTFVREIRNTDAALNAFVDKDIKASELSDIKMIFEKSIVAARDIDAGTTLKQDDLAFKKPGNGISSADYRKVLGRKLKHSVKADKQLSMQDIDQ